MLAFGIGAVGTLIGTVVAWLLVGSKLGPQGYKVSLKNFCSSRYIFSGSCMHLHYLVEYSIIKHSHLNVYRKAVS